MQMQNKQFELCGSMKRGHAHRNSSILERNKIFLLFSGVNKYINRLLISLIYHVVPLQTLSSASKLDAQLYPILTTPSNDPNDLKIFLSGKLQIVLTDIAKAQDEISHHIRTTAALRANDEPTSNKISQVLQNLNDIVAKLTNIRHEYTTLVDAMLSFLNGIIQTSNDIDQYFRKAQYPNSENVDQLVKENNHFRDRTLENFRNLLRQSEQLIDLIRTKEPEKAREHDTDRIIAMLEHLRNVFESKNTTRIADLQKEQHIYRFRDDLDSILKSMDELKDQLIETHCRLKDAPSNIASAGFEHFEQTIQVHFYLLTY